MSPLYVASFGCSKATTEKVNGICTSAYEGDVDAQYDLGIMYVVGEAVVQDYERAAYWISKAADKDHSGAQWALGLMYEHGEGVEQNYERAVYWYTKAAEQDIEGAPFKLESIQFENSYEQLKSGYYFEAVAAFQKNAELGNPIFTTHP